MNYELLEELESAIYTIKDVIKAMSRDDDFSFDARDYSDILDMIKDHYEEVAEAIREGEEAEERYNNYAYEKAVL